MYSEEGDVAKLKTAICFFGITRSLPHTIASIRRRVLAPAERWGPTRIFAHFFEQAELANPRSQEFGRMDPDAHRLLHPDELILEAPDLCLQTHDFDGLKRFGDAWEDDFRSLRNLVHQLHSLSRVTAMAQDWQPDLVIFARPDLKYHQSLARPLARVAALRDQAVAAIPSWQGWLGGLNDRFSVCTPPAAAAYGHRIDHMHAFCEAGGGRQMHAELLLKYALDAADVRVIDMSTMASRIRLDGHQHAETFVPEGASRWTRRLIRLRTRLLT